MFRTFIDTANVGDSGLGPPLVDEDGHATCQAIYKGVVGSEWENMYVEMNIAVDLENGEVIKKARGRCGCWKMPKKMGKTATTKSEYSHSAVAWWLSSYQQG